MAKQATVKPAPTLPSAVSCTKGAIDPLLKRYDERVGKFKLEEGHGGGYCDLIEAKLAPMNEGAIPGLSYLDLMNQMLADLLTLRGLKWISDSESFMPFTEFTLEPDIIHRFGYCLKANHGADSLCGWSFFENAIHGPASVRRALDYFRARPTTTVTLIIVNDEAIADRHRNRIDLGLVPGEVAAIVDRVGKHAEVLSG